jgi:HEAT repeat protein
MSSEIAEKERESIVAGLDSSDDELRRLAVERLLALPAREAIPRLVESLGDSSWRVRKAGVEQITTCGNLEMVCSALILALSDGDNSGRRNSAVEALISLGEATVPMLIEEMSSDDVDVRKLIVDAIAGIGGGTARERMIDAMQDPDTNVRAAVADALGVIAGDGVADILLTCATSVDEDQLVRYSALRALVNLEAEVTVEQLAGTMDDSLLAAASYSLLGYADGTDATAVLLKGLESSSRVGREAAMEALLRVLSRRDGREFVELAEEIRLVGIASDSVVSSAIERLPNVDLALRLVLVQFLGLVKSPECVIAILEAGRDEAIAEVSQTTLQALGEVAGAAIDQSWNQLDARLRRDACGLLGTIGTGQGDERLLEAFDSTDTELRVAAAMALAASGCGEALPRFVKRLEVAARDRDVESEEECGILIDAIVELINQSDSGADTLISETVELLSGQLDGASNYARLTTAILLGRIGRPQEAGLLSSLLKDASAQVRRAAVEALSQIDPGRSSEPLRLALADESPLVRITAASAVATSRGERVVEDLERLVHDEDRWVRAATMRAIGIYCEINRDWIDGTQELSLIEIGLSDEGAVAVAAVEALRKIGGLDSAQLAIRLLQRREPELVQAAVGCIGTHGGPEELLEVLPLISHESWAVRAEAIRVLSERRLPQALPAILRRSETEQDSFVRDAMLYGLKRLEA